MPTHAAKAKHLETPLTAAASQSIRVAPTLADNRPVAAAQQQQQARINTSPRVRQAAGRQALIAQSPRQQAAQLQAMTPPVAATALPTTNSTGLPDSLKSGVEHLSGYSLDDVQVHYNSAKPAQLQAHAYAQGTDIHLAPGQEQHLPHEAWHVVQQKQGRVRPTMQLPGQVAVNDNSQLEREADVLGARAAASPAPAQLRPLAPVAQQVMQRIAYDLAVVGKSYRVGGVVRKLVSRQSGWLRFEGLEKAVRAADVEEVTASSGSAGRGAHFGVYDSDDDAEMSDGEDKGLFRDNTKTTDTVKMHSLYSSSEQARVSIREMRAVKGRAKSSDLTNPEPTIARMGSQFLEFAPTPIRKDFGVSHMRPTADGTALQRSGNPRTYHVLGQDLDKSAARCGLSMSQMNAAVSTLLFTNPDAHLADMGQPTMDQQCMADLRELVAILALDIARSHNGRDAIETELLGSTSSFTARIGGATPEYGGSQNKDKHGQGGVQYLIHYDDDEEMS